MDCTQQRYDTGIDDTHPFISACRDSVSHKVFFSGTNKAIQAGEK